MYVGCFFVCVEGGITPTRAKKRGSVKAIEIGKQGEMATQMRR